MSNNNSINSYQKKSDLDGSHILEKVSSIQNARDFLDLLEDCRHDGERIQLFIETARISSVISIRIFGELIVNCKDEIIVAQALQGFAYLDESLRERLRNFELIEGLDEVEEIHEYLDQSDYEPYSVQLVQELCKYVNSSSSLLRISAAWCLGRLNYRKTDLASFLKRTVDQVQEAALEEALSCLDERFVDSPSSIRSKEIVDFWTYSPKLYFLFLLQNHKSKHHAPYERGRKHVGYSNQNSAINLLVSKVLQRLDIYGWELAMGVAIDDVDEHVKNKSLALLVLEAAALHIVAKAPSDQLSRKRSISFLEACLVKPSFRVAEEAARYLKTSSQTLNEDTSILLDTIAYRKLLQNKCARYFEVGDLSEDEISSGIDEIKKMRKETLHQFQAAEKLIISRSGSLSWCNESRRGCIRLIDETLSSYDSLIILNQKFASNIQSNIDILTHLFKSIENNFEVQNLLRLNIDPLRSFNRIKDHRLSSINDCLKVSKELKSLREASLSEINQYIAKIKDKHRSETNQIKRFEYSQKSSKKERIGLFTCLILSSVSCLCAFSAVLILFSEGENGAPATILYVSGMIISMIDGYLFDKIDDEPYLIYSGCLGCVGCLLAPFFFIFPLVALVRLVFRINSVLQSEREFKDLMQERRQIENFRSRSQSYASVEECLSAIKDELRQVNLTFKLKVKIFFSSQIRTNSSIGKFLSSLG